MRVEVHGGLVCMARKGRSRRKRGVGAFISAAFAVIAVSVSAVFLGYLVGHVAIRSVARPLAVERPNSDEAEPAPHMDAAKEVAPSPAVSQPADGGTLERPRPSAAPIPAPAAATAPPSAAGRAGLWRVRAGAYATREEAEAALAGLQALEPQAFVIRDGVYRVQVGAFTERARAEALVAELARQGMVAEVVGP
jgi:cell division septation protein DedD